MRYVAQIAYYEPDASPEVFGFETNANKAEILNLVNSNAEYLARSHKRYVESVRGTSNEEFDRLYQERFLSRVLKFDMGCIILPETDKGDYTFSLETLDEWFYANLATDA